MQYDLITFLKVLVIIVSVLLIMVVLLQPSKKTGLIGDTTDAEKRVKRGFELLLHRFTIVLIIAFMVLAVLVFALR